MRSIKENVMQIYLDNAATTKMSRTAIEAMLPYMDSVYGNPSSLHSSGQKANEALVNARERIAELLGCEAREITFTSGGSEADNQAIISAARIGEKTGKKHIISTAFEHHAVLHTLNKLQKDGFAITLLDVHENGLILPEQVAAAIREDTCLVTVMYANNEIGTVQPIKEIGAVCSKKAMGLFLNPRHVGVIENGYGICKVGSDKLGDVVKIYLKTENDTIVDVKSETFGYGSPIASVSKAAELIKGTERVRTSSARK